MILLYEVTTTTSLLYCIGRLLESVKEIDYPLNFY